MTFSANGSLKLLLAFMLYTGGACFAQLTSRPPKDIVFEQLPRLCRPVTYREPARRIRIGTVVPMLGDRYLEVAEALAGWKETGVPLVGKYDGKWEPVPCGDDTGLFYLVPLFARRLALRSDQALDCFFLATLAASAMIGAVGIWITVCGFWQRCLGVVPILLGCYLAFRMGDVYLFQGSVVLMLLPWLIYMLRSEPKSWQRLAICFSSGMLLGLANWIRSQAASPLLVFFAVLLYFSPLRRSTRVLLFATLIGGMCVPLLYAQFPLRERELFLARLRTEDSSALSHHLFWHTAYLGLAYLRNPYVPAWLDDDAVSYVQAVNPNAIYGGAEYESILQSRVKQIARQDRRFILYTVAAKLGVLACFLLVCTNVGLVAAIRSRKPAGTELAFWLAMAFAALPGIVAIPVPQYVIGMLVLALYYWFYSVTWFIENRAGSTIAPCPRGATG